MTGMLEAVLRRPKTVLTLMVLMIVAGVMAYIDIPKEAAPDIDVPVFYVSVTQQGISPEDAERLLARPMETALRGLDGLKEITTVSSEGHLGVILEFDIDFDKDKALADVRDKVDQAKADLPADADEPTITETNFALMPTIYVTLSGDVPERTLYRHARRLKDEIETVPTVLEANLSGHREELLEVVIDSMKLESYNISQAELIESLTQNNQLVPAGFLDSGDGRFNVKVPGLVENAQDVYSLPIKQNGEGVVVLGDVAEIKRTFKDPSSFTRVNGRPAISIDVVKRKGTNIIENNQAVREVVERATKDWPDAIKLDFLLDESSFIYEVLGSLETSILTAIFLVMILIVAALGLRSGLLVGVSIPTSFMIGFLILSALGMTVSTMVMFGLVLTVGMLVDGAIIMVEYADRKIAEGMPDREAYIRASKLMFWPIVSSTATTLAAFLPMLLWPGVAGEFMSYLPIMVIIVLSASLLTALVFVPVTGALISEISHWIGRNAEWLLAMMAGVAGALVVGHLPVLAGTAPALAVAAGLLVAVAALYVFRPIVEIGRRRAARLAEERQYAARMLSAGEHFELEKIKGLTGTYTRILNLFVSSPAGNVALFVFVGALGFAIVQLFAANAGGIEFFIEEEPNRAVVLVSGRGNMSAREALALVLQVEAIVLTVPGVKNSVMTAHASGGGDAGLKLGGVQDKPADVIGELNLELSDYCCRRRALDIFEEIRTRTAPLPGIKVEVRKIEGGPPTGKDVRLQVTSTDYADLTAAVARVRDHIETMEGLRDFEDSRPLPGIEWQLTIDRQQAGRYQASVAEVGAMVQLVTNGILIGKYRPNDSDDEIYIRGRVPVGERTLDRFDSLRLQTPLGAVPIANFVDRTPQQKVSAITRRDGLYAMDVKANVVKEDGVLADDKVKELDAWLKAQSWPDNVFFRFRGADEDQKESGAFLMKAAVGALFLMFIILVTQFNSFYQTILTLSTVVMSTLGVMLGMAVTGQKFSIIMTGTGVVALAGIVVNNAIVLIDTYNRFREDGIEPVEAVLKTSAQRIRPIMLTTITTIAGLIPMATQINFDFFNRVIAVGSITSIWWVQLSTAVIFGLAFSTVLTLLVIPTMLALPTVWSRTAKSLAGSMQRRFGRQYAGVSEADPPQRGDGEQGAAPTATAQADQYSGVLVNLPERPVKPQGGPLRDLPSAAE